MTTEITLEAMLRRASRMAEKLFDEHGEVPHFLLVELVDGTQQTWVVPPAEAAAHEYRLARAEEIRRRLREHRVVRFARAFEAWGVEGDTGGLAPAQHPNRCELVLIDADDGIECLMATRDVIRPKTAKPYLGPLSEIHPQRAGHGRFCDLLAPRPTAELADNEGSDFMTCVPDAPFQVFGRRDPTGELFVSGTLVAPPGEPYPTPDEVSEMGAEALTGPEAERLIGRVKRIMVQP